MGRFLLTILILLPLTAFAQDPEVRELQQREYFEGFSTEKYDQVLERLETEKPDATTQASPAYIFQVKRVVDGDTLELSNGERVSLIGIDTPEMHESDKLHRDAQREGTSIITIKVMGKKSYKFTKRLVEGKKVKLELDIQQRDKYGRLLAYVYLPDDTFVNAEIIKQGYAQPMTIPPNVKYADLFQKLYQEARGNKRGLWSE